jgi:hypothetical protein
VSAAKDPRIVLHVGAPKTASTYIQRRLRANAEQLRKHGIYLPVLPEVAEMAGNAKLLAVALSRRASSTFRRAFPNVDVNALDSARISTELLKDWRADSESIVLSAENLRPKQARPLRELLPTSTPCVVVLFVRRQDRWIDSYFNQLVKTNEIHEKPTTFVERLGQDEDEHRFCPDWFAHYEVWRNAFGNCQVVFYDEVASNVFGAFLEAASLGPVPGLIEIDPAQVSLNVYELAYLLNQKSPIDYAEFIRRKDAAEKASRDLGVRKHCSLLSTEDLARLRERFAESNRRLIAALGRGEEDSSLQLDQNSNSEAYCSLPELSASEAYARFQKSADAIYARRDRRDRFKSFFKRSVPE